MSTFPLNLIKRSEKGTPLSATDHDSNLADIEDAVNSLSGITIPGNRIVGLAEVQTGNISGLFAHIDENGNRLFPDPAYFNNHPVYRNIAYTKIDNQDMI
jgi:hypothetical protein